MNASNLLLGLLLVLLFLAGLVFADSYKLVARRSVLATIGVGGLAAILCYLLTRAALGWGWLDAGPLRLYVAPVLEETAKALYVVYLITTVDLAVRLRWSVPKALGVCFAGTIPFLSFVAEHRVTRQVRASSRSDAHRAARAA